MPLPKGFISDADVPAGFMPDSRSPVAAPAAAPDDSFTFQPGESTAHAMLRYGGRELLGAARSPLDALKGLLQLPGAVVKGWTEDIPTLLRDPSLLKELPGVAADAATSVAMHPEELGSLLGQAVIGKAVPTVVPKVGPALTRAGGLVESAAGDIANQGLLKGLSKAVAAPTIEKGGQLLQRAGKALEPMAAERPVAKIPTGPRTRYLGSKEVPYRLPSEMPTVDPYSPNISGFDPAAPASDIAMGGPYEPPGPRWFSAAAQQGTEASPVDVLQQRTLPAGPQPRGLLTAGQEPRGLLGPGRVFTGPNSLAEADLLDRWRALKVGEEQAARAAARQGPAFGPQTFEASLPDVRDFSFEGQANLRPGEFAPGPAAPGFEVGEPSPFTYHGTADMNAAPTGAPGFEIQPPMAMRDVPVSRATLTNNLRSRAIQNMQRALRESQPAAEPSGALSPELRQAFVDEANAAFEPPALTKAQVAEVLKRAKGLRKGDIWPTLQREGLESALADPSLMPAETTATATAPTGTSFEPPATSPAETLVDKLRESLTESPKKMKGTKGTKTKRSPARGKRGTFSQTREWKPYQGGE